MEFGCCCRVEQSESARRAGFVSIEPTVVSLQAADRTLNFANILDTYQQSALPVQSFNVFLPKELKVCGPAVDWGAVEAYVREALQRVEAVGADRVVFGSGAARHVPDGFDDDVAHDQLVRFLRMTGDIAKPLGITIVIEPLNKKESNIINSVADGVRLARATDHPAVRVLADFYHMQLEEEPLAHLVEHGEWLGHIHVADSDRFAPGTGTYPYATFFGALHEIGYTGRIVVECTWRDFEREAPVAVDFLRRMWQQTAAG